MDREAALRFDVPRAPVREIERAGVEAADSRVRGISRKTGLAAVKRSGKVGFMALIFLARFPLQNRRRMGELYP